MEETHYVCLLPVHLDVFQPSGDGLSISTMVTVVADSSTSKLFLDSVVCVFKMTPDGETAESVRWHPCQHS